MRYDSDTCLWHVDVKRASGARETLIGTGCNAVQLLPKTAAKAAAVVVFQRSPHWV